jgi:2,3-bisphosphoglycerate-dependent phosphoglycerate mutase
MSGRYQLVLLRHGQSEWNAANLFTGWVNVALSAEGEREATGAGRLLASRGLLPDVAHTSLQRRAVHTADLALAACDRDWIPVRRSWRLNSNHYGALQGRDKAQVAREVGERQLLAWRRHYDAPPPPIDPEGQYSQFADARYAALPPEARPLTESLKDVTARLLPYWYDAIVPDLRAGARVLVVSHGNTLRALIRHLDKLSDQAIVTLNVATAVPLCYELDRDLRPVTRPECAEPGSAGRSPAGCAGLAPGPS